MPRWFSFAFDLCALAVLVFGVYFPRYRRRDLVLSYIGLNVGVLAVAVSLTSAAVGAGVGFGLFGVLSIIRLRSAELAHQEIAYYFAALALALVGGVEISPRWVGPVLSVVIVVAMYLGDHPRLYTRYRHQSVKLDRAFPDEAVLKVHLEGLLDAEVKYLHVKQLDLVNDTTSVDVRYRLLDPAPGGGPAVPDLHVSHAATGPR